VRSSWRYCITAKPEDLLKAHCFEAISTFYQTSGIVLLYYIQISKQSTNKYRHGPRNRSSGDCHRCFGERPEFFFKDHLLTNSESGMGEALSRYLVQNGWKVALADIQPNAALAKELGANATFFSCNVADYDSQAAMFQGTWDKFGRIDALCANAGIVDRRFVETGTALVWQS